MASIIFAYIGIAVLIFAIALILFLILRANKVSNKKLNITIGSVVLVLILIVIFASNMYFNSESGKRLLKDIKSEYQGGIVRSVKVYTENGELIYEDKGKFDIEVSDNKLKYIDEEGKVQIIYLGNSGVAVVNEVDE